MSHCVYTAVCVMRDAVCNGVGEGSASPYFVIQGSLCTLGAKERKGLLSEKQKA